MTAIDRNNKQNQFYRKQARLLMKVFKFWEFNREKESVTYVTTQFPTNILTWLRGFQDKVLNLALFSLYPSLFWELRDKRNLKKLQF